MLGILDSREASIGSRQRHGLMIHYCLEVIVRDEGVVGYCCQADEFHKIVILNRHVVVKGPTVEGFDLDIVVVTQSIGELHASDHRIGDNFGLVTGVNCA